MKECLLLSKKQYVLAGCIRVYKFIIIFETQLYGFQSIIFSHDIFTFTTYIFSSASGVYITYVESIIVFKDYLTAETKQ